MAKDHGEQLNILCAGKYILDKKIGEGAFGEIYIAHTLDSNEKYAIKLVILIR